MDDAMAMLSDSDRELLALALWEGLDPGEIATVLDCSRNAVRIRPHRAPERFAKALEKTRPLFTQIRLVIDPGTGLPLAEVRTNSTKLADGRQVEIRGSVSHQAIGCTDDRPELPRNRN